jgi:hypothetical protein
MGKVDAWGALKRCLCCLGSEPDSQLTERLTPAPPAGPCDCYRPNLVGENFGTCATCGWPKADHADGALNPQKIDADRLVKSMRTKTGGDVTGGDITTRATTMTPRRTLDADELVKNILASRTYASCDEFRIDGQQRLRVSRPFSRTRRVVE